MLDPTETHRGRTVFEPTYVEANPSLDGLLCVKLWNSTTDEQPTPVAIFFTDRGSIIYLMVDQSGGVTRKKVNIWRDGVVVVMISLYLASK